MPAIFCRKPMLTAMALCLTFAACCAQDAASDPGCWIRIYSLKNASPFSSLAKNDQAKVLRALNNDIAEMAEIDIASSLPSRAAYRKYFISHLEFKPVSGTAAAEKLLLVRYNSNTMCGSNENCPVWIVRLTGSAAQSMVPWQNEHLGTSVGGGWGIGARLSAAPEYPELILLTHLSSTQTGLACFRESKRNYLRVDCAPECTHLLEPKVR